jgi:hypothetical protein
MIKKLSEIAREINIAKIIKQTKNIIDIIKKLLIISIIKLRDIIII